MQPLTPAPVKTNGTTPTSSLNPTAQLVLQISLAMKADFGSQYVKLFKTDADLREYKNRLYTKVKQFTLGDIERGYEDYVNSGNRFVPTVPDLVAVIKAAQTERLKQSRLNAESTRIAALPAPTIECNPLEMLAKAKQAPKVEETAEERIKKRADALKNHQALLTLSSHHIRHVEVSREHLCAVEHCRNTGALSSATSGHGNYYCAEHYHQY